MPITDDLRDELIQSAIAVRENAYAPFSGFLVGSALLDDQGRKFSGVNVENSSYGLTICAERSAAVAAISSGAKAIKAIAIASPGGASPCGACRQFLYEFGPEMTVLLLDSESDSAPREMKLSDLLPDGFRLNS